MINSSIDASSSIYNSKLSKSFNENNNNAFGKRIIRDDNEIGNLMNNGY